MREIKYTYIDLYYNKEDQSKADKRQKDLEKLGYVLEARDLGGGEYSYCDQYHRYNKRRTP